jgi:hypothetical protein
VVERVAEGWARVEAPPWLWGGRPRELFTAAGFRIRSTDGTEAVVATDEHYMRSKPDLIRLQRIAGPTASSGGWERLNSMGDDEIDEVARESGKGALDQIGQGGASDLAHLVNYFQIAVAAVPSELIGEQCRLTLESLREVTVEGQELAFQNAGVFGVRRSEELLHRIKLVSVLIRLQHDERLRGGDLTALQAQHDQRVSVFAASEGLHQGFYLMDQYLGPLLGALTPAVWGFMSHRAHGAVVFSYGRPIGGSSSVPSELLRTLPTRGADRVTDFAALDPLAIPSALSWWVDRLNDLFGVISDPAVFVNPEGRYQPSLHLQAILTTEQLFSRVLSIKAAHSDSNAQRVLLFTVLDTIEALTGRPIEKNCDHAFADKTFARLSEHIPNHAAQVLLPRARRGVEALSEVRNGFFLREDGGGVMLRPSTNQVVSLDRASAEYLKLLRNATHGHGANKKSQVEATEALLARHDGHIPFEVALLGWLYLLDVLSQPEALRRHLTARSLREAS